MRKNLRAGVAAVFAAALSVVVGSLLVVPVFAGAQVSHVAGERFSTADLYLATHLNWGMTTGAIEKRSEFVDYCAAHINRPAALRARAQTQELMAQRASA